MITKMEYTKMQRTKKYFNERFNEKDLVVFIHILKFSFLIAATIGAGYAFFHVAGGQLTIPEHFKTEVFNPDSSIGQNVMSHRYDIFWYWVDRGFYIGIASFFAILLTFTSIALLFKKILK